MRLPLATDLKARVGTPDKDARVKNGIIEIRGESSVVRQRPGVSEALATALGLFAQGGMVFGESLCVVNDDVLYIFEGVEGGEFPPVGGGGSFAKASETASFQVDSRWSFVIGSSVVIINSSDRNGYVSANLTSWAAHALPSSPVSAYTLGGVLYLYDENGDVYSTADGVSWSYVGPVTTTNGDNDYASVEFGGYVYTFASGAPKVRRSNDGVDFSVVSVTGLNVSPITHFPACIAYAGSLYFFGDSSFSSVKKSTDGAAWSEISTSLQSRGSPTVHDGYIYVVYGGATPAISRSTDGITWESITASGAVTTPSASLFQFSVSLGGNLHYLVWNSATSKTEVWTFSGGSGYVTRTF